MGARHIAEADFADPRLLALLREHLTGMAAHSPADSVHALDLTGLQTPDIALFTLYEGDELIGMGALKALGAHAGEIKSMRTRANRLRTGVAAEILEQLIETAKARGYSRLSLETGSGAAFEPAVALYRRRGFRSGEPFGDYAATPFNQFFHLDLTHA